MGLLVDAAEIQRDLLGKVLVGKLLGDDHGTRGDLNAVGRLAADVDEVRIDECHRAVGVALEAPLGEREKGQRALRTRAAVQYGVGTCGHHLENLRGDRGVGAGIALVGLNLDVTGGFGGLGAVVDEVAPGIGEADIADVLHAVAFHAVGHDLHEERGRLRHRHHPLLRRIRQLADRRDRDHRHFQLARHRRHRDGRGRRGRADQEVDLLFFHQLARIAGRGRRVGAVVELDQANGLAVDGLLVLIGGIDAAPIGDADRRAVAAQRGDEADGDVGLRSRRCEESGDKCE
ncbi:hypothetical protein ABIF66_009496 [Bradyrhizobium japonicum]